MKKLITILLISMMAFVSVIAEAGNKRLGGGKSVGHQSSNVTQKQAAPPAQHTPPVAAPAPAPKAPWGAMLGGLAAGLGLAWLASSLGMGAALGNIMMALLIGAVVLGSALTTTTWTIPAGFDVVGFEAAAKQNFVLLQGAWDRADIATLNDMMTDTMSKEIQQQLTSRDATQPYRTAVISLVVKLLGIEETEFNYVASVEFTGTIQDTVGAVPEAFEEVWNMTKSKPTGGWLLAGIQVN